MDDPNNTNSSPENTGADNRQAIFTPQPPEPTDPGTSATPAQSSVNLSHPYLSNHPTQTFNTDTGDIILNTGSPKPKQNKRPFIIGGIILAVFVAVCVGVLAIVPKTPDTKNSSTNNLAEIEFNRFATYLLYGTSSDTLSGEYESDKTYELDLQLENPEHNSDYWNKSSELLNQAIQSAENDTSITRYLVRSLRNYQEYFNFISLYDEIGRFDEERLLSSYLSGGANLADSLISNFYNKFDGQDFNIAKTYVDSRKVQYEETVKLYAIYGELGCVRNGNIDESACTHAPSADMLKKFEELSSAISKAAMTANKSLQNSITYLKSRCWELSAWLQDPVDERDGGDDNA